MFGKLIKYEWIAMIRAMLPVYVATLAVALINGITINNMPLDTLVPPGASEFVEGLVAFIQVLLALLYIAVLVGLFVMTFIVIVQRFYKGLLKDEGYLMFTLPVKTFQLTMSKAIVSSIITCISMVVGIFAIGLLASGDFIMSLTEIPALLRELFRDIINTEVAGHIFLYILECIVCMIVLLIGSIYTLYAAMALGQLSRNHKVAMSVVWYIIISIAQSVVGWVISMGFFLSLLSPEITTALLGHPVALIHMILIGVAIFDAILMIVFIVITDIVLDRKLNLE